MLTLNIPSPLQNRWEVITPVLYYYHEKMLEFGSKDNDNSFYYWASFSFRVALCVAFTFGIVLCFKRLLQKRNQEYVDIARIIQY